ncbi:baseplate wedge subunit [Synechococcus phage S-SCSM1]|uniref:Baseplate wedge subunit n=1 Tax=Synechococcus phage S-SCSM1 TaxID=2588487 RepID=A0A6M2ZHV1_9CAUD|nr:baseplate wedge subunit [Synechococcus phage S-SCSM1]QFG06269.2 baseplate wedge subunit [Synechococcus phage S-SCSM1]
MPVERISRGFKDLSMTFNSNPLTEDLITLKNDVAIARSVRNLVMTYTGERFFQPNLGSQVSRLLFEPMSPIVSDQIKDEITRTITTYEPRVELQQVICQPRYDENDYAVTVKYKIIGLDLAPTELSFLLQPTR